MDSKAEIRQVVMEVLQEFGLVERATDKKIPPVEVITQEIVSRRAEVARVVLRLERLGKKAESRRYFRENYV